MIFRIRFEQKGGHIHCRLFQATAAGHTWQKNGEFTFDERGWGAFSALMNGRIEMVREDYMPVTTEAGFSIAIPDCDCRNPRCGHKASKHTGPGGACTEPGCECGPGGWT